VVRVSDEPQTTERWSTGLVLGGTDRSGQGKASVAPKIERTGLPNELVNFYEWREWIEPALALLLRMIRYAENDFRENAHSSSSFLNYRKFPQESQRFGTRP